jgi:3-oxoadipate enol-lactonase
MPTVNNRGADIYYETKGTGEAIVFAHGAGGNAAIWFNQIAHFAPNYQVVAFDHRCFARSPAPADSITVHQFRDDLIAIMDELKIDKAHLIGQSMGGFTVLRCALDLPDRVQSLTMSCTSGGIVNPNPTPAMRNLTSADGNDSSGIKATMSKKTFESPALIQLYESVNNFNTEFSWDKLRTLLGKDDVVQLEQLADVSCPVLFFAGAEDPLFPAALLESYIPHFNNARIEVVTDSGHSPYFEQPGIFNSVLEQHISKA